MINSAIIMVMAVMMLKDWWRLLIMTTLIKSDELTNRGRSGNWFLYKTFSRSMLNYTIMQPVNASYLDKSIPK
jgi:hypothetical protein